MRHWDWGVRVGFKFVGSVEAVPRGLSHRERFLKLRIIQRINILSLSRHANGPPPPPPLGPEKRCIFRVSSVKLRDLHLWSSFFEVFCYVGALRKPAAWYRVSNKKATQAFGSCSRTRVPILFKFTMDIVWTMAKNVVTKANSLGVLPHLECVWLRRLHFCFFHWTRRSLLKKFSWDHPKTRLDVEKCPEQKDKSLRTPFASNYDRIRLWDVRQGCQPPPFGGPWTCPRWSAGSGPTSSAFFKSLLRVTHKMFMLITDITCFAIYLGTQQCINFYFRGNISSFMTENNSSRFFWTLGK